MHDVISLIGQSIATVVFAALIFLTVRRGVRDPVCGMTVDGSKALREGYSRVTRYFCSEHCRRAFAEDPARFAGESRPAAAGDATEAR